MMWLTRLSVAKPFAVITVFAAVALAGLVSYSGLPINQFPRLDLPVVTIATSYAGVGPDEIEVQITRVIEDAVAGLANVDYMTSVSSEGASVVTLNFTDKANSDLIATMVERQVDAILRSLPADADRPIVNKLDPNQSAVMQIGLIADELSPTELFSLADENLRPRFEHLNAVGQVTLVGGQQQEVEVWVDPIKLAGRGLSLAQLQSAISQANASVPGGSLTDQERAYTLRLYGLVDQPEDLGRLTVGGTPDSPIQLQDVGTVKLGAKQQTQITRINGHPAVLLRLSQRNGANSTDVSVSVNQALPQIRADLPRGAAVRVIADSSAYVGASLKGVQDELITAVILTAVVLLVFLHSFRVSVIVLLSIPTTLLTTFVAMHLLDFSLNVLSLLALVLTIGILVDDSIVILENILRRLGHADSPADAAINGRAEIGLAALAITLVDVVIFAPTGLVSGQIGAFFKEFGFTVASATLISLVVSFTLTPMLAAQMLNSSNEGSGPLARFGRWWDSGFARLEANYGRLLSWSLDHRPLVLLVAAASLGLGLALIATGRVGVEFFPQNDQGTFSVETSMPPETSLAAHDAVMRQVEDRLLQISEVQTISAQVGGGSSGGFGGVTAGQATTGNVSVDVGPARTRQRDVFTIAEDARARLSDIPNVRIRLQASTAAGAGQPISVRLQGPDTAVLSQLARQLELSLRATTGLTDVTNSAAAGTPELRIQVDRARAAEQGISASAIGSVIRTAYSGVVATRYRRADGKQIDVRILLNDAARTQANALGDLPIQSSGGATIRLGQIASISEIATQAEIDRRDRQRIVTVGANLGPGVVQSQVSPRVQQALAQLALPPGYTATLGGISEQQAQSFAQLFTALGLSITLAYLLMAILYNSLIHPLVILFGLPVAAGGAIISSFLFGYTFNLFSLIGLILLVGLAIKNGILLVDRTNQNRRRGLERRLALLEAGPARLRPILMTSVTIAVALIPSAFRLGEGSELRAPLAATVLGGVVSSTLLTLVVVPVVYTLLDGLTSRIIGLRRLGVRPLRAVRGQFALRRVA
jgi:HAE1 family hydrophobic/amphiphilic exporter-1